MIYTSEKEADLRYPRSQNLNRNCLSTEMFLSGNLARERHQNTSTPVRLTPPLNLFSISERKVGFISRSRPDTSFCLFILHACAYMHAHVCWCFIQMLQLVNGWPSSGLLPSALRGICWGKQKITADTAGGPEHWLTNIRRSWIICRCFEVLYITTFPLCPTLIHLLISY